MPLSRILCALALFLPALAVSVQADYFVWQDPDTGVSFTYPDTWRSINNQKPDDVVTIIGPSQQDRPICRLRVRPDNRFTYYPAHFSADVQHVAYNNDFFEDYFLGDYKDVTIQEYHDDAGLGRAFAGHAVASFTEVAPPSRADRMGEAWAGVYFDKAYIMDCSATSRSFSLWQHDFASIAKSVEMRKVMTAAPTGYYPRDFLRRGYNYRHQTTSSDVVSVQRYNN